MKAFVRITLVVVSIVAFVFNMTMAQDLQQQLSTLGRDAAVGYISPILAGWGNDLNSGIYYSADLHDILGFDVGLKVAMSKFNDADKTYSLTLPTSVKVTSLPGITIPAGGYLILNTSNYPSSTKAGTAVGSKDNTLVKTTGGNANIYNASGVVQGSVPIPVGLTALTLPGGFDPGSLGVPIVMPQLNLGLPFGLEVMVRYVPTISAGDAGKFNYMGFGLRYNVDQWLPLFPVNIAVHFMTQKMNFKSSSDADIFSAKATAYGVEVSKKLFILTLYGGFQLESSTLTLADYQYKGNDPALLLPNGQGVTIKGFDVNGTNSSRITVGARVLLLFINVHAEYSIATNPVLALGVGISLR